MTFRVIRNRGQGHVRLKVSKMTIFKFYFLCHFSTNQKIPTVSDTRPKYLKKISRAGFLNVLLVTSHVTSNFAKKSTPSDLNEIWYDVRGRWDIHNDMTFKVIWGQGKVRRWPQSPIGTIFFNVLSCGALPYPLFWLQSSWWHGCPSVIADLFTLLREAFLSALVWTFLLNISVCFLCSSDLLPRLLPVSPM